MFDGLWPTEFSRLYVRESQDLRSSDFSSVVVPTKEDPRSSLLDKGRREDLRPPTTGEVRDEGWSVPEEGGTLRHMGEEKNNLEWD